MSNSLPTSRDTSTVTNDRYERGLDAYADQFHIPRDQVHRWFADRVGDRSAEAAILSAANAWVDDELSLRDRSLAVIAALITKGDAEQQLRMHAGWAIDQGATRQELEALATLLAIYVGYPRAANGLALIRDELAKLETE